MTLACLVVLLSPLGSTLLGPISLVAVPAAIRLLALGRRNMPSLMLAVWLLAVAAIGAGRPTELWFVERGWAVLLGGGFVVSLALYPGRTLFAQAMLALLVAGAAVAVVAGLRPELVSDLQWQIEGLWEETLAQLDLVGQTGAGIAEAVRSVGDAVNAVVPARLALASLAALGCTAYVAGRMEGEAAPLGPVRLFRFSDHYAWLLAGGLVLLIAPVGSWSSPVGLNLVVLMAGLYVARGLAVLAWLGTSVIRSGWSIGLWTLAALLLYPVTLGTAFVMGLSDTWLDLRSRLRVEAEGE